MAGQPKTKAKKLAEVEERAYRLSVDLEKLCPHQYREWKEQWDEDSYAAAWNRALRATKFAAHAVNCLLGDVEERALGADAANELEEQRDKRRGLWPLDEDGDIKPEFVGV